MVFAMRYTYTRVKIRRKKNLRQVVPLKVYRIAMYTHAGWDSRKVAGDNLLRQAFLVGFIYDWNNFLFVAEIYRFKTWLKFNLFSRTSNFPGNRKFELNRFNQITTTKKKSFGNITMVFNLYIDRIITRKKNIIFQKATTRFYKIYFIRK